MRPVTIGVVRTWLKQAAWAPLGVLVLHAIVVRAGHRENLDWLVHMLGGAAMAFFLHRGAVLGSRYLGELRPFTQHLLAFGLTCFVIIAWEIAEFWGEKLRGARSRLTLADTMGDQMFGILGAVLALIIVVLVNRSRK